MHHIFTGARNVNDSCYWSWSSDLEVTSTGKVKILSNPPRIFINPLKEQSCFVLALDRKWKNINVTPFSILHICVESITEDIVTNISLCFQGKNAKNILSITSLSNIDKVDIDIPFRKTNNNTYETLLFNISSIVPFTVRNVYLR